VYSLFHYQQRRSVCNIGGVNPFHSLPFFPVLLSPLFTSPLLVSATKSSYNWSDERFELPQRVWAGSGAFSTENHAFGDKIDLPTLICVTTVLNLHCTHCFTRINDNLEPCVSYHCGTCPWKVWSNLWVMVGHQDT